MPNTSAGNPKSFTISRFIIMVFSPCLNTSITNACSFALSFLSINSLNILFTFTALYSVVSFLSFKWSRSAGHTCLEVPNSIIRLIIATLSFFMPRRRTTISSTIFLRLLANMLDLSITSWAFCKVGNLSLYLLIKSYLNTEPLEAKLAMPLNTSHCGTLSG